VRENQGTDQEKDYESHKFTDRIRKGQSRREPQQKSHMNSWGREPGKTKGTEMGISGREKITVIKKGAARLGTDRGGGSPQWLRERGRVREKGAG
jgi:hypothetical protein